MRLLFITQDFPPGIGGIQTYSAEYASRLSRWCGDFLLICPHDHEVDDLQAEREVDDTAYDFDIHRIEVRSHLLFYPLARVLPKLLNQRRFDASFHAQWQTVAPALRARRRGELKRVFVAAHARELLYNPYRYIPLMGWLYQKRREYLLRRVDHFFPVSEFTAGLLKQQGVKPDRITVMFNGTDHDLFRPKDVSQLKREMGLEGKRLLLTVTRLVKRKGIEEVLHAVKRLQREFDDLHYMILGSGPEEASLKQLASTLGIADRVHFTGRVPYRDLPDYYNMADLFVMSSRATLPDVEGFGIVFLEANGCEKPVIGTRSGGVESAIQHNRTGLVIDEADPEALLDAIRSLLNDPERAAAMGRAGRKRVIEETNWDVLSRRLFSSLEALVGEVQRSHSTQEGETHQVPSRSATPSGDGTHSPASDAPSGSHTLFRPATPVGRRTHSPGTSTPLPRQTSLKGQTNRKDPAHLQNQGTDPRKTNRRLLMIAPYFLPRRRVGALRPFRFATHLKELGWEPYVVTIRSNGQLTTREREALEGVQLYEIDPRIDLTGNSGSQLQMEEQRRAPQFIERLVGGVGRWASSGIDRHCPMDTWLLLFIKEYRSLLKIARDIDADMIWSTGDPWSGHWLAERLSRSLELPWIADFRDPWTLGGVSLRSRSRFSSRLDRRFEQRFIRRADHLVFTSSRTRELYANHYPEIRLKSSTITNSFDTSLLERLNRNTGRSAHVTSAETLELIFFGRFRGLSPASPVIELLAAVRAISPEIQSRIRVTSFGPLLPDDAALAKSKGVLDSFHSRQPVPPEAGPELLSEADILLISTDPRRTSIIPAKLWDYLPIPVPVLSIAPNPEIDEILKQTGAGRQFELSDLDRVASLLADCVAARLEGREMPLSSRKVPAQIEAYSAHHTTTRLTALLDQVHGESGVNAGSETDIKAWKDMDGDGAHEEGGDPASFEPANERAKKTRMGRSQ